MFPVGTTTVTWTATNETGGIATCTQSVTVNDCEAPDITCPQETAICADEFDSIVATSTDPEASITNDAPAEIPIGPLTVTWTAEDAAGNAASCTQIITIKDCEPPVINCPEELVVDADAGKDYATIKELVAPLVEDASDWTITNDAPKNGHYTDGTTVIWTATDAAGNTATCDQLIVVNVLED